MNSKMTLDSDQFLPYIREDHKAKATGHNQNYYCPDNDGIILKTCKAG